MLFITLRRLSARGRRVNMNHTIELPAECTRLILRNIQYGRIDVISRIVDDADKSKIEIYADDDDDKSPDSIVPFTKMYLEHLENDACCIWQLNNKHLHDMSMIIRLSPRIQTVELINCWTVSFVATASIDVIRVRHCALENAFIDSVKRRVEVDLRGLSTMQIAQVPSQLLFLKATNPDARCRFIVDNCDGKSSQMPPPLEHFKLSLCSDCHICEMHVSNMMIDHRDVWLRNGAKCEWSISNDVDIDKSPALDDDTSDDVEQEPLL